MQVVFLSDSCSMLLLMIFGRMTSKKVGGGGRRRLLWCWSDDDGEGDDETRWKVAGSYIQRGAGYAFLVKSLYMKEKKGTK